LLLLLFLMLCCAFSRILQSVKDMPIVQDMPPVGGFPSIRIQRRLPSTGPTGMAIFAVGGAVMAYGYYQVSQDCRGVVRVVWIICMQYKYTSVCGAGMSLQHSLAAAVVAAEGTVPGESSCSGMQADRLQPAKQLNTHSTMHLLVVTAACNHQSSF
jgi:hypothetical protein